MTFREDQVKPAEFDSFAAEYDAALDRGLSLSGETKDFFAHGRVQWLKQSLGGLPVMRVLDYGCGVGSTSPLLKEVLGASSVIGVDVSKEEIALAKVRPEHGLEFSTLDDFSPAGDVDVAYCNGVFHHIPLDQRSDAMLSIRDSLRPGGLLSFWENNPWNPGTRLVMSRIPFDRDAILVSAREARRLARAAGLEVLATHFLFVFPKLLGALRPLEASLSALPLGAQYQVLCRKPRS